MGRGRKSKQFKICIRFTSPEETIEYISKTPDELWVEYERILQAIKDALRALSRIRFVRNIVIATAQLQLQSAVRPLPEDISDEELAKEIARLSKLMEDTIKILSRLSNSRTQWLEEARFILTYGQTPKKKEMGAYL